MENKTVLEVIEEIKANELAEMPAPVKDGVANALLFFMLLS